MRSLAIAAIVGLVVASTAWAAVARTVSAHAAGQKPHLSEQRIRRIAERWATRMEDPTPILVQHSEGTRRKANLIAADDLIGGKEGEAWSYLIAERGHFEGPLFVLRRARAAERLRCPCRFRS